MLSRRSFLAGSAALAAVGAVRGEGLRRKCRPLISGSLWWSQLWSVAEWRDELDKQRAIGFDLLWIVNTHQLISTEAGAAGLSDLLDLCAARKVRVILGTGSSPVWYGTTDPAAELELCSVYIRKIGKLCGGHRAFRAWYVPHEIYFTRGEQAKFIDTLYRGLVEQCRKAADLPVTVSPFFILDPGKVFGDFYLPQPEEYSRYWSRLLRATGFDIVMMQDSGEHFSYVTNEMRRPYFQAMAAACESEGARFWGNVEVAEFECPSIEDYVKRYGRVHHSTVKNAPWRPVPMKRLQEKLDLASEFCEDIVSWGYQEFCRPVLGDSACKWYADYKAYYRMTR